MATYTFASRCSNQKLIKRPSSRRVENGIPHYTPGEVIEFERGRFETTSEEVANFIRNHRFFGSRITELQPGDLGPPRPSGAVMRRGVAATKPTEQTATGDRYRIPCEYPGCEYVAEDDDEGRAIRKLNGHKTRHGHHVKKGGEG